jgi:hypothetical protein
MSPRRDHQVRRQRKPRASGQAAPLSTDRFDHWRGRGLSLRAAVALADAGCDSAEDVARLGPHYFAGKPNLGRKTLQELTALVGFSPARKTVIDAVAAALALTIPDLDEARDIATDVLIALRRSGFVVVAPRSAPRRRR